jgi:hypothetical protein
VADDATADEPVADEPAAEEVEAPDAAGQGNKENEEN